MRACEAAIRTIASLGWLAPRTRRNPWCNLDAGAGCAPPDWLRHSGRPSGLGSWGAATAPPTPTVNCPRVGARWHPPAQPPVAGPGVLSDGTTPTRPSQAVAGRPLMCESGDHVTLSQRCSVRASSKVLACLLKVVTPRTAYSSYLLHTPGLFCWLTPARLNSGSIPAAFRQHSGEHSGSISAMPGRAISGNATANARPPLGRGAHGDLLPHVLPRRAPFLFLKTFLSPLTFLSF